MKIKDNETRDKYLDLARELKKNLWNIRVMLIPIVIGVLRLEGTCCHSDPCERPSANAGVKNLQGIISK